MINNVLEGYILILGFVPVLVISVFWYFFLKSLYRRLRGEGNDSVMLEKTVQKASLPSLIVILVQIIAVGLIWIFEGSNLIPVVVLNFLYFYLNMLSVRFVLTHLDSIEKKVLKLGKEGEKVYLSEDTKLSYNKYYHLNLVGVVLGVISMFVVSMLSIPYLLGMTIIIVYYVLFGYLSAIQIPNTIKFEYIDKVLDRLKEGNTKEN